MTWGAGEVWKCIGIESGFPIAAGPAAGLFEGPSVGLGRCRQALCVTSEPLACLGRAPTLVEPHLSRPACGAETGGERDPARADVVAAAALDAVGEAVPRDLAIVTGRDLP